MDPEIERALARHFSLAEVAQIKAFLDRGFSLNGQIVIASIFMYAVEHQIPVERVLAECEKEWTRNWGQQHPTLRGDGEAPGGAGVASRKSVINIYQALGIPTPDKSKVAAIPKGALVVSTMNSTYSFGPADINGERSVSRQPIQMDCGVCRIISLFPGYGMEVLRLDGSQSGVTLLTSPVIKIE